MAEKKNQASKRGCMAPMMILASVAVGLLLAVAVVYMVQPQDLTDIEGYGSSIETQQTPDLTSLIREALDDGRELTITEEELNVWLGRVLKVEQKGMLGVAVDIKGLGIRLGKDQAEIVIERSFAGLHATQSMYLQVLSNADSGKWGVDMHGKPIVKFLPVLKQGGRFGQLSVPQGYIYLVSPCFSQLAKSCKDELDMIMNMETIRLEEGKVVLTPPKVASAGKES